MKPFLFLIFTVVCFSSNLLAQNHQELEITYKSNIPLHQEVVSGGYYVDPPQTIEGDPYFKTKNFQYGSIVINGLTYTNVSLLYNTYSDEVVTFHPVHKQKTLLRTDKIDAFELPENKKFIRIADNPEYSHHANGFYELVADGSAKLLCKHYKTDKPKSEISQYSSIFVDKFDFLIQNGQVIQEIKNRKTAIALLGLDKKAIKRGAKEKSLDYRNDRRDYLSFMVNTYNLATHE